MRPCPTRDQAHHQETKVRRPSPRATSYKDRAKVWQPLTLRAGASVPTQVSSTHLRASAALAVRRTSRKPRLHVRLGSKAGLTTWRGATPPHLPTHGTRPSPANPHDANDSKCQKECHTSDVHHDQAPTPQSELSQRVGQGEYESKGKKKVGIAFCENSEA